MKNTVLSPLLIVALCLTLLQGCSSTAPVKTLDSLDIRQRSWASNDAFVEPKTEEEVKAAYDNYIKQSARGESSRLLAIHRLAEIEIQRLNSLLKDEAEDLLDTDIVASLERTRDLLQTSLNEFPKASNNDETLYQLARVLDQLGSGPESIAALTALSTKHPNSRHYPEVQFRLAEAAFVRGDYIAAEDAYSEVLLNDTGQVFHERALFKRGWSRYKQGLYIEAIDDYLGAIKSHPQHRQVSVASLGRSTSDLDEYYRAAGLAFASFQDLGMLQSYFAGGPDEDYLYPVYLVISNTYLEQERYSDAAGLLRQFIELNPLSRSVPLAELQIAKVWRDGGFRSLFLDGIESFYKAYHPAHPYWKNQSSPERDLVLTELREISMELAGYYHQQYSRSSADNDFAQAQRWYQVYLEHYASYAQQDKFYSAFAELLLARQERAQALHYFELAAYDGDIILDKEAAYATIVLASELLQRQPDNRAWLNKQAHYALLSARLYPSESRYQRATLHAAEAAYEAEQYNLALQLLDALPDQSDDDLLYKATVLEGLAYRQSGRLDAAESIFTELLKKNLSREVRQEHLDNLALVIYLQAEQESAAGNANAALQHYSRIAQAAPDSTLAPLALYESILIAMDQQHWQHAIQAAEHFQTLYEGHERSADVMRHASSAYLQAGDTVRAAKAFEQLASDDESREVQMAALWQAAELYDSREDTESAIRSYRRYAHTYTRPFPQYVEAMHRLSELYQRAAEADKRRFWQEKIVEADSATPRSEKTSRSNYLTALAFLDLGNHKAEIFRQRRLTVPLADSLRIKRQLLQDSSNLLGRASAFGFTEISTQATYVIAGIYQNFSRSLLESERPVELEGEELIQYDILLEDQAFPFEEKAIEFYEMNLARVKDGAAGEWIMESHKALAELFPARYARPGKVGIYRHD